jgi:hypothetical protein
MIVIDDNLNLQNGRHYNSNIGLGSLVRNNITIGNTQLFKEYRQLDSSRMPKWWGYPYQNGIIKGIYDVVSNKCHKLTIEEIPHNKTSFIESSGETLQYINTKYLVKDTDIVLLRA